MEYVVESFFAPQGRYINLVNYGGYYFDDGKRAISACGQFLSWVCECEVRSFEPYFISHREWSKVFV